MCGISGFNFQDTRLQEKMNLSMFHRGPDGSGHYVDENLSLGHVLLSLRGDVGRSKQPMTNTESSWVLVFNGEIYNTKEIKNKVSNKYENEEIDTVLIFALVERHGWDFIHYIQGMFAIALYNKKEKKLKLYRDPSGQKSLYYYAKDHLFVFSSEIEPMFLNKKVSKDIDLEAIELSTLMGYIPGDRTIFRHIKKLRVGECLDYNLNSKSLSLKVLNFSSDEFEGMSSQEVMADTIKKHLQSHEKMAINLSGGMDSAAVFIEAVKKIKNINVYTSFFDVDDPVYDQDPLLASRLGSDYGVDVSPIKFKYSNYLECFEQAYSCVEEPNYNLSLPLYMHMARSEGIHGEKNKVVFSGDGGDELFGGYTYYLLKNRSYDDRINQVGLLPYNLIRLFREGFWLNYGNFAHRYGVFKFFKTDFNIHPQKRHYDFLADVSSHYEDLFLKKEGSIYNSMLMDRVFWLANENFVRNDKIYMSQSIELRAPLSYHPLREYFDKVIPKDKYMNEQQNKILMRSLYKDKMPSYIVDRKDKWGWHPPIKHWYDKECKSMFLDLLSEFRGKNSIIDWDKIYNFIEQKDEWPGKEVYVFLSLAMLFKKFKIQV